MDIINSREVVSFETNCDTPNFQDPHHVGAVFGYVFNKVFSDAGNNKKESLSGLLKWAKRLSKEYSQLEELEPGEVLFRSIELAQIIASEEAQSETGSCEAIKAYFPGSKYACAHL